MGMLIHADQLREISDLFGFKCEMKTCQQTQRHFESESTINIVGDHSLNFFANLLDSLHFYICHCYDAGFRVDANEKHEESKNDKSELFDADFNRMNKAIRQRDDLTASFERISSAANNSKFSIASAEEEDKGSWVFSRV